MLGALYAFFGFFLGLFFLITALFIPGEPRNSSAGELLLGPAAPVFFLILYGLIGFVGGFVCAWIYNFIARMIGGIELDIEIEKK